MDPVGREATYIKGYGRTSTRRYHQPNRSRQHLRPRSAEVLSRAYMRRAAHFDRCEAIANGYLCVRTNALRLAAQPTRNAYLISPWSTVVLGSVAIASWIGRVGRPMQRSKCRINPGHRQLCHVQWLRGTWIRRNVGTYKYRHKIVDKRYHYQSWGRCVSEANRRRLTPD